MNMMDEIEQSVWFCYLAALGRLMTLRDEFIPGRNVTQAIHMSTGAKTSTRETEEGNEKKGGY